MPDSGAISYREMALLCLAQSGEPARAAGEYRRMLGEFPGSKMAEMALRMLEPPGSVVRKA